MDAPAAPRFKAVPDSGDNFPWDGCAVPARGTGGSR